MKRIGPDKGGKWVVWGNEKILGVLDLLEFLGDGKPRYFKQFRELENERTSRKYSLTTISSRLKDLITADLVEHTLTETETSRKVAGYRITRKGVKALKLSNEYENKLNTYFMLF